MSKRPTGPYHLYGSDVTEEDAGEALGYSWEFKTAEINMLPGDSRMLLFDFRRVINIPAIVGTEV